MKENIDPICGSDHERACHPPEAVAVAQTLDRGGFRSEVFATIQDRRRSECIIRWESICTPMQSQERVCSDGCEVDDSDEDDSSNGSGSEASEAGMSDGEMEEMAAGAAQSGAKRRRKA